MSSLIALDTLTKYIKDDLPHVDVFAHEHCISYNPDIEIKIVCKLTSHCWSILIDKTLPIDYFRMRYDMIRREIITKRGEEYTKKYTSPTTGSKYSIFTDEYEYLDSKITKDIYEDIKDSLAKQKAEELKKAELVKTKREKELKSLKNYGLF